MQTTHFPNHNLFWAKLIVEELARNGVEYICLAPGSRSAPLAIAANEHPQVQCLVHYDERGLGFFALGIASASHKPVAVITTSGTAVANLFPSVIEASKKKLPLIVITADRPPELRFTGANQTIDQVKIFGDYVRFFFDLPCPSKEIAPAMVLTTVDQMIFRSTDELPGPVHLNCMFRDPLSKTVQEPIEINKDPILSRWRQSHQPFTTYLKAAPSLGGNDVHLISTLLRSQKRGIITVGKIGGTLEQKSVLQLAKKLQWPIFADVTSGLVLGQSSPNVIRHFDQIYKATQFQTTSFDFILHLGGRLTSNVISQYLKDHPHVTTMMVIKHPLRHDPDHRVHYRIQAPVSLFSKVMGPMLLRSKPNPLLKTLQKQDLICANVLDQTIKKVAQISEPALSRSLSQMLAKNTGLFVGNSMPIRDLDMFAIKANNNIVISANRGASGIDGNIASSVGFALATQKPTTVILGDLTTLHDLNSLSLIKHLKKSYVLIVINNHGGAIFSFLPVAKDPQNFEKCFVAPQDTNFKSIAKTFRVKHYPIHTHSEFTSIYRRVQKQSGGAILEVFSPREQNFAIHENIKNQIKLSLS